MRPRAGMPDGLTAALRLPGPTVAPRRSASGAAGHGGRSSTTSRRRRDEPQGGHGEQAQRAGADHQDPLSRRGGRPAPRAARR